MHFAEHLAVMRPTGTRTRGPRFTVSLNDIDLVTDSKSPALDASRALRARGISGTLALGYAGSDTVAMRVDINRAAGLTVAENTKHGPRFAAWTPYRRVKCAIAVPASEAGAEPR